MAADVLSADGQPRFVWTDERPDPTTYALTLLRAVAERQSWSEQYERAKTRSGRGQLFGNCTDPPDSTDSSASPDDPPHSGPQAEVKGERSESAGHERSECS